MDERVIPKGLYCHGSGNRQYVCPYWSLSKEHEVQDNGYCAFLKEGDWESKGISHLWDQVKECGINE